MLSKEIKRRWLLTSALFLTSPVFAADLVGVKLPPETASVTLKSGTNVGMVRERCSECHTVDYIVTQPPQSRASWKATVDKMSATFKMPALSASDEDAILTYLSTYYGS